MKRLTVISARPRRQSRADDVKCRNSVLRGCGWPPVAASGGMGIAENVDVASRSHPESSDRCGLRRIDVEERIRSRSEASQDLSVSLKYHQQMLKAAHSDEQRQAIDAFFGPPERGHAWLAGPVERLAHAAWIVDQQVKSNNVERVLRKQLKRIEIHITHRATNKLESFKGRFD